VSSERLDTLTVGYSSPLAVLGKGGRGGREGEREKKKGGVGVTSSRGASTRVSGCSATSSLTGRNVFA